MTKATATNEICKTIVEEYSSHDIGIGSPANLARLNVWADAVVPQQRALYIRNYQTLYDGQPKYGMEGFVKAKNNDEAWGIRMYAESDNNICVGAEFSAKCFGTGASASSFGARLLSKGVGIQNCGAYVEANDAITNYGINAIVKSIPGISTDNYGGSFYAEHASVNNYGVSAASEFGTYTYGIKANASLGTNCYGVYGSASSGGFNAAGYFSGDCWATTFQNISDSIFKSNITNISSAISVINQLSPKSYNFDFQKYPYMNFPKTKQYGLIAQDVEKILPSLVSVGVQPASIDSLGNPIKELQFKGVNYIELIPILIQAVKEQQTQITNLQNQINSCCPNNSKGTNSSHTITTKLTDIETIILDQNEPNPFAEETNISYFIPESAGKAELMFYTNDGRLINKVEIKEKGQGTLHIYASDLSSGIYTYTLMVNGKVEETKRMMKSK